MDSSINIHLKIKIVENAFFQFSQFMWVTKLSKIEYLTVQKFSLQDQIGFFIFFQKLTRVLFLNVINFQKLENL